MNIKLTLIFQNSYKSFFDLNFGANDYGATLTFSIKLYI